MNSSCAKRARPCAHLPPIPGRFGKQRVLRARGPHTSFWFRYARVRPINGKFVFIGLNTDGVSTTLRRQYVRADGASTTLRLQHVRAGDVPATLRRQYVRSVDVSATLQRQYVQAGDVSTTLQRQYVRASDICATLQRQYVQ